MQFLLLQVHAGNSARALERLRMMHGLTQKKADTVVIESSLYVNVITEHMAKVEEERGIQPKSGKDVAVKRRVPLDYQTFLIGRGASMARFADSCLQEGQVAISDDAAALQDLEAVRVSILQDEPLCDVVTRLFFPQRVLSVPAVGTAKDVNAVLAPCLPHLKEMLASAGGPGVTARVCSSPGSNGDAITDFVEVDCGWTLSPGEPTHCVQVVRIQSAAADATNALFLLGLEKMQTKGYVPPNRLHPSPFAQTAEKVRETFPQEVCRAQRKLWELHFICRQLANLKREAQTELSAILQNNLARNEQKDMLAVDVGASPGGWVAELIHRFGAAKVLGIDPGALEFKHEKCLHVQQKFETLFAPPSSEDSSGNKVQDIQQSIRNFISNDDNSSGDASPLMIDILACDMNRDPEKLVEMIKAMMLPPSDPDAEKESSPPFLAFQPSGTIFFLTMKNTLKSEAKFVTVKNKTMQDLSTLLNVQLVNSTLEEFKPAGSAPLAGYGQEIHLFANTTKETTLMIALR